MSHEYTSRYPGQEGVFIDEKVCEDGCIHISCAIYDEEGDMIFHTDFPRGVTAEEISEFVLFSADCVLDDSDNERNLEKSYEIAEGLRKYAKRIPGL
jgi:hypothetical protein